MTSDLQIRPMSAADMDTAVDWAAREGWNPGLGDGPLFRSVDPDGFLVGTRDGEPVAVISVAAYDARFAFLGLYIVRPDMRGRGYGSALWAAGMTHAGARTIGLDGVVAQQANYRRSGFAMAHRNVRFAGTVRADRPSDPRIREWDGDLAELAAYDAGCFPARRQDFLQGWLTAPGHRAFVARTDGRIAGYGVARPCREDFKIAPLFAQTPELADRLFCALASLCGSEATIILDAPEPNAAAVALAERHGLRQVFETARMYRGTAPDLPLARIFGITSFELG